MIVISAVNRVAYFFLIFIPNLSTAFLFLERQFLEADQMNKAQTALTVKHNFTKVIFGERSFINHIFFFRIVVWTDFLAAAWTLEGAVIVSLGKAEYVCFYLPCFLFHHNSSTMRAPKKVLNDFQI